MEKFEVNILGCGSAVPTGQHMTTAQLVNIHEKVFLVDCGEGTQIQIWKSGIKVAYFEWYYTQIGKKCGRHKDCWIGDVPELNNRRAPGNTCITALQSILRGKDPYNNSKGCGGIMRTAPVALYGAVWRDTPEGDV